MIKRPAAVFVFLVFLALFLALLTPRLIQVQSLKSRGENLQKELIKLRRENQALENELHLLREDPVYLEKVARVKLNKAKQGEIVYKIVREGDNTQTKQ